eukprot:g14754.t1
MRKVKLGLASAGALSASFLKVFGGGNSKVCNEFNTQHTAPPPLESGSPSNARPLQSSTSFSRVFGSDHETTSSPSFSRVFGFDHTSSPSPSTPTSVFKTEPPVSSLHSTLGFLSKTASTPTPSDEVIDFRTSELPLYVTLDIPIPRYSPEVTSELAADHRSGFKTKQEGDNWRTRSMVSAMKNGTQLYPLNNDLTSIYEKSVCDAAIAIALVRLARVRRPTGARKRRLDGTPFICASCGFYEEHAWGCDVRCEYQGWWRGGSWGWLGKGGLGSLTASAEKWPVGPGKWPT